MLSGHRITKYFNLYQVDSPTIINVKILRISVRTWEEYTVCKKMRETREHGILIQNYKQQIKLKMKRNGRHCALIAASRNIFDILVNRVTLILYSKCSFNHSWLSLSESDRFHVQYYYEWTAVAIVILLLTENTLSIFVCMYVCIYIYIYICTYTVYILVYIYIITIYFVYTRISKRKGESIFSNYWKL